jgi:hypothetical protein
MSASNPHESDLVLGGQNPPSLNAAVLGGEAGRKKQLQHEKSIAREDKFWSNFKYLHRFPQCITFDPNMQITNPQNKAYFLGTHRYGASSNNILFEDDFNALVQQSTIDKIEGLYFGYYDSTEKLVNSLVSSCKKLTGLRAICLGAISEEDRMISEIYHGNISKILVAYEKLEILHIKGRYLRFCNKLHHQSLKSLQIISGGLNREAVSDLSELDLPALKYLEIWLGSSEYGGNSCLADLIPIITGEKFPTLKYLGLKNCEYTDDIALELSKSPFLENLLELDLSMGTLGDEALAVLLTSPMINELDKFDISQNYISDRFIAEELPRYKLKGEIITEGQRQIYPDYDDWGNEITDRDYRYCVVSE